MAGIVNNNPALFEELINQHRESAYGYAYSLCGKRDDAEDLVQDAFLRIFNHFDSSRVSTFAKWMYHIITNLYRDKLRRSVVRRETSLECFPDEGRNFRDPQPSVEDILERKVVLQALYHELAEMSNNHQQMIRLADIEELSREEIIRITGDSAGTISSRLYRARLLLRQRLQSYVAE